MRKIDEHLRTVRAIEAANTAEPSGAVKFFKALLIVSGLFIFLVTMVSLLFNNFNFGVVILVAGAGLLVLYGLFFEKLIKLKWLNNAILTVFVITLVMMLGVGVYGKMDNATFQEDAAVVLGAGIRGERVSLILAGRLDKAVEYSEKNPEAVIIVSGARGPQESITEALAMEKYLIGKGIPEERIVKEEEAASTYENLAYAKALLDELFEEPYGIAVITNDFHMFRASRLAAKLGLDAARVHSSTIWYEIPKNYLRECVAIGKFLIMGK